MSKLFKKLTTEENLVNFGRIVAILVIIAGVLIIIETLSNPQSISFGLID